MYARLLTPRACLWLSHEPLLEIGVEIIVELRLFHDILVHFWRFRKKKLDQSTLLLHSSSISVIHSNGTLLLSQIHSVLITVLKTRIYLSPPTFHDLDFSEAAFVVASTLVCYCFFPIICFLGTCICILRVVTNPITLPTSFYE